MDNSQAKSQLLARAAVRIQSLSPEYKEQWEDLLKTHPWLKRDKDGNLI